MINKVTHISLFVHDQDEALVFYTEKLGFQLHTDAVFNENFRWLTISLPQQKDVEIALMPAMTDEARAVVGKQAPDVPFLALETDDCRATYQELKKRGVKFIQEPNEAPWGIQALFVDLYGNIIHLNQSK